MLQQGKLENIKREMDRCNIKISGLLRTKWKCSGILNSDECKITYAGGEIVKEELL